MTKKIESGPFETLRLEGRQTFYIVKFPGTIIKDGRAVAERGYSYAIASPGDQYVVCEWVTTHPPFLSVSGGDDTGQPQQPQLSHPGYRESER